MQTELLSDNEIAAGYSRRTSKGRVADFLGMLLSLPAAVAVLFVVARFDSSKFSLAAMGILFLVSLISACSGLLVSFWMRSPKFLWLVRAFCAGWLMICAWKMIQFVIHMAGFSH